MNPTQIQCFLFLSVLAVIGFGPISITCLIGFHIVINRPPWFLDLVRKLYHGKPGVSTAPAGTGPRRPSRALRIKCFLSLLALFMLDIAPVPVAGTLGLFIVVTRPQWFYELVERVY